MQYGCKADESLAHMQHGSIILKITNMELMTMKMFNYADTPKYIHILVLTWIQKKLKRVT